MRYPRIALLAAALIAGACGNSRADTFDFSFSGPSISASGTLTATLQSSNEYLVTAISGTYNGLAIGQVLGASGNFNGHALNDDLLYYPAGGSNPAGTALLDNGGLYFYSNDSSKEIGVYYFNGNYQMQDVFASRTTTLTSFDATIQSNPGPLPGAGILSYIVAMIGGVLWGHRTVPARTKLNWRRLALSSLSVKFRVLPFKFVRRHSLCEPV
ncbi:MAG TPA: hypothetical protein VHL13_08200 [Pseudolabrys sp.]|nr:hypothetical protein [Pseudolabrys sp.]